MHLFSRILNNLRRRDADLDDELRAFYEASVEAKLAAGMPRAEAERAARIELGSPAAVKEWVRDVSWASWLETVWQDVRYGMRTLRRDPRFAAAAILPLALGIGTAIAVCSVAYGILLRPLPVHDEASLAVAHATTAAGENGPIAHPRFEAWRDSGVFQALAASSSQSFDMVVDGLAERLPAEAVAGDFFGVLGVGAAHGRVLNPQDSTAEGIPAVISDSLWTRRFGGDPDVLGGTVTAGIYHLTIVGVMPPGFERWRGETHVWVPAAGVTAPFILASHGYQLFTAVGRLHPGSDRDVTSQRLAVVDAAYRQRLEPGDAGPDVRLVLLRDDVVGTGTKRVLAVLLAAAALTWLVACAFAANLLLARGTRRATEFAVRMAIGAGRGRIVRHLLAESLAVAVPAGALGLLTAWWGIRLLVAYGPPGVIGNESIRLDWPIAVFAALLTASSAALFGVLPALRLSRVSLNRTLGERAAPRRLSGALIAAQVAVAVIVLAGATVLVRSAARMTAVDLGFDPRDVLTVGFSLPQKFPGSRSPAPEREWRLATQEAMLARLGALPGVESVALSGSTFRPIADIRWSIRLDDGRRFLNGNPQQRPFAPRPHMVTPGYFRLHGVTMLEGRDFTAHDRFDAPRGLLAYGVAVRRRELGIRIALGARPVSIVREVLRQAAWPVASGLVAGLVAAWLTLGVLSGLLFEVAPRDPLAFATAAALVSMVSLTASYFPARRAARVDPVAALRAE